MKSSAKTPLADSGRWIPEDRLERPVRRLFSSPQYDCFSSVRVNDRQIDAVFRHRRTRRLVAVEMKVKNWRRALEQAAVYQLFTRSVYVAMWHKYWNSDRLELFQKYGVGVILVEPSRQTLRARYILKPSRGISPNRHYSAQLRGTIEAQR